ncbi:MAG: tetratricopeptide repeat protein [Candidatus Melainabacteria bacterium]|nr:tetratricopeptide repeat protein [Candidatus Melainabacteria bacterium]
MIDRSTSTSLPAYSAVASSPSAKEDFGRLVRRIQQSNSGQFTSLKEVDSDQRRVLAVHNRDWSQYRQLAMKAQEEGNLSQAESMWLASLGEAKSFHLHDPRLLVSVESLAGLYASLERFDQAESFSKQAVDIAFQAFGNDHPNLARCLNNLAGIYYQQGRYAEAEPVSRRLLAIYEKNYPADHPDVIMATINLAMLYHVQGKYKLAERLYIRVISLGGNEVRRDQTQFASVLANYAGLLQATGRKSLATEVRRRGSSLFQSA